MNFKIGGLILKSTESRNAENTKLDSADSLAWPTAGCELWKKRRSEVPRRQSGKVRAPGIRPCPAASDQR